MFMPSALLWYLPFLRSGKDSRKGSSAMCQRPFKSRGTTPRARRLGCCWGRVTKNELMCKKLDALLRGKGCGLEHSHVIQVRLRVAQDAVADAAVVPGLRVRIYYGETAKERVSVGCPCAASSLNQAASLVSAALLPLLLLQLLPPPLPPRRCC